MSAELQQPDDTEIISIMKDLSENLQADERVSRISVIMDQLSKIRQVNDAKIISMGQKVDEIDNVFNDFQVSIESLTAQIEDLELKHNPDSDDNMLHMTQLQLDILNKDTDELTKELETLKTEASKEFSLEDAAKSLGKEHFNEIKATIGQLNLYNLLGVKANSEGLIVNNLTNITDYLSVDIDTDQDQTDDIWDYITKNVNMEK